MDEYSNQSSYILPLEKSSKLGKNFVFLLLILITILAVGGIVFATKFVSKEVEESDTQVLPVVLKPGSVNFVAIDLDADGKKETISFDQTPEKCGSGGCAFRVDDSVVIPNSYAPVYGVFVDNKITQFIVEQKIAAEGCTANACMSRSLVLYDFDFATKSAIKVSEDVEISENAVLLFTTEIINEYADWQTYRNEEYGFEFKYPINVEFLQEGFGTDSFNDVRSYRVTILFGEDKEKELHQRNFNVRIYEKELEDKILSSLLAGGQVLSDEFFASDFIIGRSINISRDIGDMVSYVLIDGGSHIFVLKNTHDGLPYNQQIIQTFKFIDKNVIGTSNWKTYKNEEYGFEFKYPKGWVSSIQNLSFYAGDSLQGTQFSNFGVVFETPERIELLKKYNRFDGGVFSVGVFSDKHSVLQNLPLDEWLMAFQIRSNPGIVQQKLIPVKNIGIDGRKAYVYRQQITDGGSGSTTVFVENLSDFFVFNFYGEEDDAVKKNMDQILSTFKFTK